MQSRCLFLIHISSQDSNTEFYFLFVKYLLCNIAKPDWELSEDTSVALVVLTSQFQSSPLSVYPRLIGCLWSLPSAHRYYLYVTTLSCRIGYMAQASTNHHIPIYCIFRVDLTPLRPKRHKEGFAGSSWNMETSTYGRGSM